MRHTQLDSDLKRRAALLRESRFFVDPSGDGTNYERQTLFLVLAGEKPVGEASSGHWEPTKDGRRTVADDPESVGEFLSSLGLEYRLSSFDGHATDALVALDHSLLAQYQEADAAQNIETIGLLFGYPETAATAFAADSDDLLLDPEESDRRAIGASVDPLLVSFRLSRDHWAEELAVVQHWQQVLVAVGLAKPLTESSAAA